MMIGSGLVGPGDDCAKLVSNQTDHVRQEAFRLSHQQDFKFQGSAAPFSE